MNENIRIKLKNGDYLVAEIEPNDYEQIAVGIEHDGVWIQDLAVIEPNNELDDQYDVYVFGSEYDEGYTEHFGISRVKSNAI